MRFWIVDALENPRPITKKTFRCCKKSTWKNIKKLKISYVKKVWVIEKKKEIYFFEKSFCIHVPYQMWQMVFSKRHFGIYCIVRWSLTSDGFPLLLFMYYFGYSLIWKKNSFKMWMKNLLSSHWTRLVQLEFGLPLNISFLDNAPNYLLLGALSKRDPISFWVRL